MTMTTTIGYKKCSGCCSLVTVEVAEVEKWVEIVPTTLGCTKLVSLCMPCLEQYNKWCVAHSKRW